MLRKTSILCAIFLFAFILAISANALEISAEHAILMECDSGDIVFQKNAFEKAPMASTTKIMTAVVAIENGKLDKIITIPREAVGIEGSSIYLKEGERLTLYELLCALLLESANDAATAIAIEIGGSIDGFAQLMNEKAYELGLFSTHFTNPHGLDDSEHYTSARDLASLSRYAMKIPQFYEIVSSTKKTIPHQDDSYRILINHNKLLKSYLGAIGVKTGFTKKSGRCLVSCAERDGVQLIAVTLDAPNDWKDHQRLLDYGFEQYESIPLAQAGDYTISLSCINGQKNEVICSNLDALCVTLKKGDSSRLSAVFESERFVFAPIKQGERVGKIVYYLDEKEIASLDICALESIKTIKYKKSIFERIFG